MLTKKQNADLALARTLVQKYQELIPITKGNGALALAGQYERHLASTKAWIANMERGN